MLWILGPHTGPLLFDAVASLDTSPLAAARYHGDQDVAPGVLDFAVNVRHDRPPEWLVRQLANGFVEDTDTAMLSHKEIIASRILR